MFITRYEKMKKISRFKNAESPSYLSISSFRLAAVLPCYVTHHKQACHNDS